VAQPTPYSRQYNFTNFQTVSPTTPLPANYVDLELNTIKATLDQTLNNLKLIQRDDTALASASVGKDQLKAEVSIGINPPSPWITAKAYVIGDTVTIGGKFYRCLASHTSGVFATDLAALDWSLIIDFNTVAFDMPGTIHGATAKTIPNDADEFPQADSAAAWGLKKTTWANFKATMFSAWGALIATGVAKAAPVDADAFAFMDSAAANATKMLTWANLKATHFTAWGALTAAGTAKATPVGADMVVIADSAAGNATKMATLTSWFAAMFTALGPLIAAATGKSTPVDTDGFLLTDSAASGAGKLLTGANLKKYALNGLVIRVQTFAVSGTYTSNANMVYCLIRCFGGGAGGGGCVGNASFALAGSGGGSGGLSEHLASAAAIGASKAVTVPAAVAGSTGAGVGTSGGTTSVGPLCIANGGLGGQIGAGGGAGGAVGTGNIATHAGSPGGSGTYSVSAVLGAAISGQGGSLFGGGAAGVFAAASLVSGLNAQYVGGGGSGAASDRTTGNGTGGAGYGGYVEIIEFCSA
jgi:hypothetical protein